ETGGDRVAVEEDAIRRVADGGLTGGPGVLGLVLLVDEEAVGVRVVRGPGVPHGGRGMEEIPRVDRRRRRIPPYGVEQGLVPDPRDRVALEVSPHAVVDQVQLSARSPCGEQPSSDEEQRRGQDHNSAPSHPGASTVTSWLAETSSRVVSRPPGQRTTSRTVSASPRPEWRRGSSDER